MKSGFRYFSLVMLCALAACNSGNQMTLAEKAISVDQLKKDISVLASDDFLGRAPTTPGEEKTINYLAARFRELGLSPCAGESFFQQVPLLKITSQHDVSLKFAGKSGEISLNFPDEFIGYTPQPVERIDIQHSDVVFAGYGIVAPEYNWNDYAGLDVKGKTVLTLVNDPGFASGDTSLFCGKTMTYYGRWTYKFEEALRQGAKAVIVIHETEAASYGWQTVKNSWGGPVLYLEKNIYGGSGLEFTGWMTTEAAKKLFQAAGLNYGDITAMAARRGFKPVPMDFRSTIHFTNKVEHLTSNNVVALLPGTGQKDEFVIYSAHWDHFGIKPNAGPDSILNGALDNATGVAALFGIASAFKCLPEKQKRSILFIAVTAEESGLLGSEFYASNPIYPLQKTAGVVNMDGLNIFGKTRDMVVKGAGYCQLEDFASAVLKRNGRVMAPDPMPGKGSYFRSDHFSFARKGVPSLCLVAGVDDTEHGKEWGIRMAEDWNREHYHMPSDNYEPGQWNFEGMMDDIRVYFEIGYDLSMTDRFPQWTQQSPFKKLREDMMRN